MTENLVEATLRELRRARKLLTSYRAIPAGLFGTLVIQKAIDDAERAIGNNDVVELVHAYAALTELE